MSRIFWDTNLFIYLFEDYGELSKRRQPTSGGRCSSGEISW